jgi:hypothetical protein
LCPWRRFRAKKSSLHWGQIAFEFVALPSQAATHGTQLVSGENESPLSSQGWESRPPFSPFELMLPLLKFAA